MILLILAHPYPQQSLVNRALIKAVKDLPEIKIHSLYDVYPDFYIDVEKEQTLLKKADLIIWQHPLFWYSAPALMNLWFEKVLTHGWAYGPNGYELNGKKILWVTTTGGELNDYATTNPKTKPLSQLASSIEQTAIFCGMEWLPPFVVHNARHISADELKSKAVAFRQRVIQLSEQVHSVKEINPNNEVKLVEGGTHA